MSNKVSPCLSDFMEYLSYNPDSGLFTWIKRPSNRVKVGDPAGSYHPKGYLSISLKNNAVLSHRLAWAMFTGSWPSDEIDHVNGVRDDNRIANLREATRSQNMHNTKRYCVNTSGVKGVSWYKKYGKWMARLYTDGAVKFLGYFDCIEDAERAVMAARIENHKEFSRM